MPISESDRFSKTPASIEIAIPEGVSALVALEWAVERLLRMIDLLEEAEDHERALAPEPVSCSLILRSSPSEIYRYAMGEDLGDVL